jgi:nitrogen fixation protein FixH
VSNVRIVIDASALESIARDPEILAVLVRKAQEVKAKAVSIAPVKSGDYASKFRLQSGVKNNKAFAKVVNTDPAANVIELGARGGKNPRFRVLGRALEAVRE